MHLYFIIVSSQCAVLLLLRIHFSRVTCRFYIFILFISTSSFLVIFVLSSIFPSPSLPLRSFSSSSLSSLYECEIAKVWRQTMARNMHVASASVGAGESASRTYLGDGTCASAIFHHSRKVRGGCTLRNQEDTRHRNYFCVSRRHNSGVVCPSFYIFFL